MDAGRWGFRQLSTGASAQDERREPHPSQPVPRLQVSDGAQGVARMPRSGRREREGCGTGAGGRPTSPRPEASQIFHTFCSGHRPGFESDEVRDFHFPSLQLLGLEQPPHFRRDEDYAHWPQ